MPSTKKNFFLIKNLKVRKFLSAIQFLNVTKISYEFHFIYIADLRDELERNSKEENLEICSTCFVITLIQIKKEMLNESTINHYKKLITVKLEKNDDLVTNDVRINDNIAISAKMFKCMVLYHHKQYRIFIIASAEKNCYFLAQYNTKNINQVILRNYIQINERKSILNPISTFIKVIKNKFQY